MERTPPSRILIVKASSLGDLLHTFPLVAYLKHKFPKATIHWVVEAPYAPLIAAHPDIHTVHTVDTRRWRNVWRHPALFRKIRAFCRHLKTCHYDLAIDLQGNLKSSLLLACVTAKEKVGFGLATAPEKISCLFTTHRYNPPKGRNIRQDYLHLVQAHLHDTSFFPTDSSTPIHHSEEDREHVDCLLRKLPQGKLYALVCPGSAWKNKQLPLPLLIKALAPLQLRGFFFLILWGSPEEKKKAQALADAFPQHSALVDPLSLPALHLLMSQVNLVVSMDSLPLHLAASAGTTTYSFFGPSSAQKYAPQGDKHHHLQGPCPYGKTFEKRCPKLRTCPTGACLHLPPEHLANRTSSWLESFQVSHTKPHD